MTDKVGINSDETQLVRGFNEKDHSSHSAVYSLLYPSLYLYCKSLYKDTQEEPFDIIQDVFIELFENQKIKFNTLKSIKGYMYVAIKNRFLMYCRHRDVVQNSNKSIAYEEDYFVIQAAEAEIYSLLPRALSMLPEECARTLSLSIQGYSIEEISKKLDKKPSTIYNQRREALSILRKRLPKDKLLLILTII